MKLFETAKTGFTLESITHKTEKRRDGDEKVITLGCVVMPFDAKLATSMDDLVRGSLFKRSGNADPHSHISAVDFRLPIERQDVDVYAAPDTVKASLRLIQVKASHVRAKLDPSTNLYTLKVRLTFGPASDKELAFVESWRGTQRFLTFEESQPDLAYEEIGNDDDEDDDTQPALDMDVEDKDEKDEKPERAQHRAISHAKKRNARKK